VFAATNCRVWKFSPMAFCSVLLATSPSPVGTFHGDDCIHDNCTKPGVGDAFLLPEVYEDSPPPPVLQFERRNIFARRTRLWPVSRFACERATRSRRPRRLGRLVKTAGSEHHQTGPTSALRSHTSPRDQRTAAKGYGRSRSPRPTPQTTRKNRIQATYAESPVAPF